MPRSRQKVRLWGKGDIERRSLLDPVSGLGLWARKNRGAIADARQRFDADGKRLAR